MSNENTFSNLIKNTLENLKNMIDIQTIVGKPIETSKDTTIIPLSKLTFGFITGGSEITTSSQVEKENYPFTGGSSSGVSIKPIALIIVKDESVRLIPIDNNPSSNSLINSMPQLLNIIENLCSKPKQHDDFHKCAQTNAEQ